jgi:hypothetical protein
MATHVLPRCGKNSVQIRTVQQPLPWFSNRILNRFVLSGSFGHQNYLAGAASGPFL